MTNIKAITGLLAAVVTVVGGVVFEAAPASATRAPIVISYEKTCDETVGHCVGTAGRGGTIEMQITSYQPTRDGGARLTLTEWITVGDISFTAEMKGHFDPDGFIVLHGRVTEGSFVGRGSASEATSWASTGPRRRGLEGFGSRRRVREPAQGGGERPGFGSGLSLVVSGERVSFDLALFEQLLVGSLSER